VRRKQVVNAAAVILILLAACDSESGGSGDVSQGGKDRGRRRPNILIILTDDQRATGTMRVMDATRKIFGDGGTRFRWGVVTTPLCCPSRASIFSGRYAHNHRVKSNADAELMDADQTMQHELQRHGYTTALVGRYLNAWSKRPPFFDRWAVTAEGYFNPTFNLNGREVTARYDTTFLSRVATRFLGEFERRDHRPWMLQIAPFAPHRSALPEPKYEASPTPPFRPTRAGKERTVRDKPPYVRALPGGLAFTANIRAGQLRTLLSVDDLVEEVFKKLHQLDETRNTLAFFLSDNGFMWHEHRIAAGKRLPYKESVLVPFYVRWPGHIEAGSVDDERIVANLDVAPTVYEAAGISASYPVDGRDILSSNRRTIFIESWADPRKTDVPTWRARWTPADAYIRYYGYGGAAREYYGPDDPSQLTNVYGDGIAGNEPTEAGRWDEWLRASARCAGSTCP
jgi:arylsulfatase A-like enzyme